MILRVGFLFEGDLLRCTMGKSPSFTTIWDNTFGVFSKHPRAANPTWSLEVCFFFHPMRWNQGNMKKHHVF